VGVEPFMELSWTRSVDGANYWMALKGIRVGVTVP
jgi:hypothetical protein